MTGIGMAIDGTAFSLGRALDKRIAYEFSKAVYEGFKVKTPSINFGTPVGAIRVSTGFAKGLSTTLKVGGATLGVAGLLMTATEYANGKVSGTQASIDAIMGVVGFFGPVGAAASILYFGGKALYEYSSGDTLFEKPR